MQSLHLLLEREEAARDAARAALLAIERQAQAAQAQAEQLVAYRADYQRRWNGQFARSGAIEIVHCYRGFMDRLEQAVAQQQRIAQHQLAQVAQARAALQAHERRIAALRKLIERRHGELQRAAQRREQKQMDETAQRLAWQARGELSTVM